ncbi:MAG: hypothetical protein K2J17_03960 [Paramuribaculum sp.]|nr:hypothetical protein [Paramuribaculum sp.]
MYSETIKLIIAGLVAGTIYSCGPSETERQQAQAAGIIEAAKQLEAEGQYVQALEAVNSIDSLCPKALDARKEAHVMKPQLMLNVTAQELQLADSTMVASEIRADELMKELSVVKAPYESFYGYTKLNGVSPLTTPGIYGQLSLQGLVFHLTASGKGSSYDVRVRITDRTSGESVETSLITYDNERNRLADNGLQIITLTEAESAPLGAFVSAHRNSELWLGIITAGGKAWSNTPISDTQIQGVATLYEILEQRRTYNSCKARKEHLTQKLTVLRNQLGEFADSER